MDGIEFGNLEQRQPESRPRPDRNRAFSVVVCGEREPTDLPVFVDLDVMREMEGHARSNTHVELGGVLLGGKYLDQEGNPYVIVEEALRAEHYEATRGSFKFTHDTWAQITRDREDFANDLQLVGWYHTHPDWGVFLSGMDLFICDHFFNDALDVALVIDPVRGDRGWFSWQPAEGGGVHKQRLSSFYLFSSRFRRSEVLQFANEFSEANPTYFDPRYENPVGDTSMQPVVNINEHKSPALTIAVVGMLMMQLLVLALIAWRVLFPPATQTPYALHQRNEIYREILGQMVENPTGGEEVVDRIEQLASRNVEMQTDLDGRSMIIDRLKGENRFLSNEFEETSNQLADSREQLEESKRKISNLSDRLEKEEARNDGNDSEFWSSGPNWLVAVAIALAMGLIGLVGGGLLTRTLGDDSDFGDDPGVPSNPPLPPGSSEPSDSPDLTIGESDIDSPAR